MQSQKVKSYLKSLNIQFKEHAHFPVYTCEDAQKLCKNIPGIHSKNLFLKNKDTNEFFLIILPDCKRLDIKSLSSIIGKNTRFGNEKELKAVLDITPGAVSPLALINNQAGKVTVLIDKEVWEYDIVSFHPCINTQTLEFQKADFQKFIRTLPNKLILIH